MASRKIDKEVLIADIHFDEDLYPRKSYDWFVANDYKHSMQAGVVFPPITLALYNNRLFLVDGKYRTEAKKLLKKQKINAIVYTGWDKRKIFEEAIKSNINHGKTLSPHDKRLIAMKLRKMDYSPDEISGLIHVPVGRLQQFVGQRLVNSITGEIVVKSPLKNLVGRDVSEETMAFIEGKQGSLHSKDQGALLDQFIMLLEGNLLDLEDKRIMQRIEDIKALLNQL